MAATPQRNKQLPKPVDFDQLYPGRFLKSGELLGEKRTFTIDHVEIDELEGEKGKKIQGVIVLQETEKQIVLNKTNGLCLRGMFGRKLSGWEGKRITIYQDSVRFGPDMVDAIRIWGSPDIERDADVIINLPKKKPFTMTMHRVILDQPARAGSTSANPPAVADYDACTDRATFDALEKRRADVWKTMPPSESKNALKRAADAAKARLAAGAEASTKNVQADLVGTQREPYTEQAAVDAIRLAQSAADVDAIVDAARRDIHGEIPVSIEAAANDRKESLAAAVTISENNDATCTR